MKNLLIAVIVCNSCDNSLHVITDWIAQRQAMLRELSVSFTFEHDSACCYCTKPFVNAANIHRLVSDVVERNASTSLKGGVAQNFHVAMILCVMLEVFQSKLVVEIAFAILQVHCSDILGSLDNYWFDQNLHWCSENELRKWFIRNIKRHFVWRMNKESCLSATSVFRIV